MKFKLTFRGEVKTNPKHRRDHINDLRLVFHRQLEKLYELPPYNQLKGCFEKNRRDCVYIPPRVIRGTKFVPLVCPELKILAELDVVLLHPELLGMAHGDIDNRMKTLLDALKRPQEEHDVPENFRFQGPLYTLLDDDKLVTELSVNTSHFLDAQDPMEILLVIAVTLKASQGTPDNLPFVV